MAPRFPLGCASAVALLSLLPQVFLASSAEVTGAVPSHHHTAVQGEGAWNLGSLESVLTTERVFGRGDRRVMELAANPGNSTGGAFLRTARTQQSAEETPVAWWCAANGEQQTECSLQLRKAKYMKKTAQTLYTGYLKNPRVGKNAATSCDQFYTNPVGRKIKEVFFSVVCPGKTILLSASAQDRSGQYIHTQSVYTGDINSPDTLTDEFSSTYVVMKPMGKAKATCLAVYVSVICAA